MNKTCPSPSCLHLGPCLALLAGCLAAVLTPTHAAQPSVQPLLQPGKWPAWPRGLANDVKVVGNYAYVALGEAGLTVIDVSNPTNCLQVGGYVTGDWASGVAVSGNYAYVAAGRAGLQVIDVSDPANCARVCSYRSSGEITDVAVSGNYAYVADSDAGLQVIDVRNPTNCVRVGGYDGSVGSVAVAGNYAYSAAVSEDPYLCRGVVRAIPPTGHLATALVGRQTSQEARWPFEKKHHKEERWNRQKK